MIAASAAPIPDLLTALYTSAAALVQTMNDPAVIETASLKDRANALNAISRFAAMLHKYLGQALPAQDGQPQPADEKAAAVSKAAAAIAAAGVRLPAPVNVDAAPALNRHERRQRDALLRRSKSA